MQLISPSTILRSVELTMFKNNDCNKMFNSDWVKDDMICAGEIAGGEDACQGDSGGPLSFQTLDGEDELWWVFGAVSFGVGCGRKNLGGVYANIPYYTDWIANAMAHYDSKSQS